VKQQVKFTQANLLDTAFSLGAGQYDIVFCRNLLIYFDRETQDRAAAILERSLTPTGLLFVGSSETPVFLGRAFTPANIPMAFALRKGRRETKPKRPAVISTVRPAPPVRAVVPAPAADPVRHSSPAPLDEALKMADQGRFTEAWRSCEEHLRRNGPSADAFYVLGLVRDALGNADDAAACYRKALYLHPAHREAVVHLALLLEKRGNSSEAQALMNRAKRLSAPRM
jgi:chemotaxis protein methyltransferase WspC